MGKNCALGLEYGPRPTASGRTQDLRHSFFPIRTSRPVNNIYISPLEQVAAIMRPEEISKMAKVIMRSSRVL